MSATDTAGEDWPSVPQCRCLALTDWPALSAAVSHTSPAVPYALPWPRTALPARTSARDPASIPSTSTQRAHA